LIQNKLIYFCLTTKLIFWGSNQKKLNTNKQLNNKPYSINGTEISTRDIIHYFAIRKN
jgi:hypothetical protein